MGKKNSTASLLPTTQSLRKASSTLERHIYRKSQSAVKKTLMNSLISPQICNLGFDLLREVNTEARLRKEDDSLDNSEELRLKIKERERVSSNFEESLQRSQRSYQQCAQIFRGGSLKRKFRHLLALDEPSSEEEQQVEIEDQLVRRVRALYRRYRVSNMYGGVVERRFGRRQVNRLIARGILKQKIGQKHRVILSLIS